MYLLIFFRIYLLPHSKYLPSVGLILWKCTQCTCVDKHLQFHLGFDISSAFSLLRVLNPNIYPGLVLHSSRLIHLNCLVLFEGVRSFCFASSLFIPQSQRQFCEESKNRHITRVNLWHLQSQQISVRWESVDSEFNYVKTKKSQT